MSDKTFVAKMNYLLLLCLVSCASAASWGKTYSLNEAKALFEEFIVNYNRQYGDEQEKKMRFEIFNKTLVTINELNERHDGVKVFGINQFSDFTAMELSRLNGLRLSDDILCSNIKTDADVPDSGAPDSLDWRDRNVVTEVKSQYQCGACYAFSSTGNIEGQYALKHGQLLSLSEQQIVDCYIGQHDDNGCGGGFPSGTFLAITENGGIEQESDYPFTQQEGACRFDTSRVAVTVSDCNTYNLQSQEKLKQLLFQNGPISVCLDATNLPHYTNQVMKPCLFEKINHAVLLVGYGTDPIQGDYWLFKNSWGSGWGEAGYFRIERGEGVTSCGMMNTYMASAIVA